MEGTGNKYISRLLEISGRKLEYLEAILLLTRKQADSITEEGVDSLQKLIAEKQRVIDEVKKLDEEYTVYFQRFKSSMKVSKLSELDASGIEGAGELKDITGRLLSAIREIDALEKQNDKKAKELFEQFGKEIKKISAGKKITSSYISKQTNPPSFFFDKKK